MRYFIVVFLCLITVAAYAQPADGIAAKVGMYKGRPMILLDGIPEYPIIYSLTDVPGGRWSWEELPKHNMQNFCRQGFRLVQVDLFFDQVWRPDGSLDMDTARRQLRGVLDNCPAAAIFIRFHVNAPKWWQRRHPEENTVYADTKPMPDIDWGLQRIIEDDEENPTRFSLASQRWLRESGAKLREFLDSLQRLPEARSLVGIQVACGVYGEWHYWGFIGNEPDMSVPMQMYFRDWLRRKYKTDKTLQAAWNERAVSFASATIPGMAERKSTRAGIFRHPMFERKVIDYYEAQHELVADDILYFCKIIKENWPRPIITGAFYGYYYAVFGREAAGGHLALQKVLTSPWIDYLSGPGTYYPEAVNTGDPYRSRSLITSVTLHGKLWLDEMDQQPPLVRLKDTSFAASLSRSIAHTRRNVLSTATKGQGLWFYDFGPSGFNGGQRLNDHGSFGWWDEPTLLKDIGNIKKLLDRSVEQPYDNPADVLLVHSTDAFIHTGSDRRQSYMGHWTNNWIPPAIYRTGVVHDVIHVDDLSLVDPARYKAIVFVNTWVLTAEQRRLIRARFATGNRHLIFLYAPGYSDGRRLDIAFTSELTGMDMRNLADTSVSVLQIDSLAGANLRATVWNNRIDPLPIVTDEKARTLGRIGGSTGFARKEMRGWTSWFLSIPVNDVAVWRYLLKESGAHLYAEEGDIMYAGNGMLVVHTARGGARRIKLVDDRTIDMILPANSTTVLDARTGEKLMP